MTYHKYIFNHDTLASHINNYSTVTDFAKFLG